MHSILRFAIAVLIFTPVAAWAQTVPPAAVQTALPPQPPATSQFSAGEIIDTGHHFFGAISLGLASVVEKAVSQWGLPNGYILGEQAGGAFVGGLRYGDGTPTDQQKKRLVKRLTDLGYAVEIKPLAA